MIGLIKRLLALPHRTFRITVGTLSGVAADRRQIDFLPIAGLQSETQALILFSLRENATSSEVPDCPRVACAYPVRVLRTESGSKCKTKICSTCRLLERSRCCRHRKRSSQSCGLQWCSSPKSHSTGLPHAVQGIMMFSTTATHL